MKYYTDCYNINGDFIPGDHFNNEEKGFVTIAHIAYLYLKDTPIEIIIRDRDDVNNPCFYILRNNRTEELYKVSLFDNSYTVGLDNEAKKMLTHFLRWEYNNDDTPGSNWRTIFHEMKFLWVALNSDNINENDIDVYNHIDAPKYI